MNCPICNEKSVFIFESSSSKRVFECGSVKCNHLFVENHKKGVGVCHRGDDLSERKLKLDRDQRIATYGERNKRMFEVIFNELNLKRHVKVLDFGSADGSVMFSLREIFPDVNITCVEPHVVFRGILQEVADEIVPSVKELKDEKFDLIFMNEVVEHLNDPVGNLRLLSCLLKDIQSAIYIATPLGKTHLNSYLTGAYSTDSHLHFFTRKSLNMCLHKSGLTALDTDDCNYPIYSTLLENTYKGRLKQAVMKKIKNLLRFNKNYCVLPAQHVSGLCYRQ